jgi:hypothetical protein
MLQFITDVFLCGLGKKAGVRVIKDLLFNFFQVMTDERILAHPDGDNLIKAINLVTQRLIECSNQTDCYCALVDLLSECCDKQANFSPNYQELVMKCIWRQIRRLSPQHATSGTTLQYSDDLVQQIDTCQVFAEIHAFLTTYPSSSWQGKPNNLPLRTVKTLVYHLANAKRNQVVEDLRKLNLPEDSEIKTYVGKLMRNGFGLSSTACGQNMSNSKLTSNKVSPTQPRQNANTSLNRVTYNVDVSQRSANTNMLRLLEDEAERELKADTYKQIAKDLKKKYTGSRTEV